jgi:hypothetical protein
MNKSQPTLLGLEHEGMNNNVNRGQTIVGTNPTEYPFRAHVSRSALYSAIVFTICICEDWVDAEDAEDAEDENAEDENAEDGGERDGL